MIEFTVDGDTRNTDKFLESIMKGDPFTGLEPLAQQGVEALRSVTPRDTGRTADSWFYEIEATDSSVTIYWLNDNDINGFNVAVGLQYGHGTGHGGWVEGYDYINPAIRPIFDAIAEKVWKEVQNA
jgi:hypothetical protein